MFKKYLEWLPNRFQQARDEGLLDTQSRQKELPEWFSEFKSNNDEYNSYHVTVFPHIKKNNDLRNIGKNFRLVIFNNNYYTVDHGIHDSIILYLIENEGLDITEEQFDKWNKDNDSYDLPFLCCQADIPFLFLSESYIISADLNSAPDFMKFENVLKRIGLVFAETKIWSTRSYAIKEKYLRTYKANIKQMIENFRRTGNAVPKGKPFYISKLSDM
jgi:hypothetical protein